MAKTEEKTQKTTKTEPAPVQVTKYSVDDLCTAARQVFDVDEILARTALQLDGKESYSQEEARRIINIFRCKEVKR